MPLTTTGGDGFLIKRGLTLAADAVADWYDDADARDQLAVSARRLSRSHNLLPPDCVRENMPPGVSEVHHSTATPPHAGTPFAAQGELTPVGPNAL